MTKRGILSPPPFIPETHREHRSTRGGRKIAVSSALARQGRSGNRKGGSNAFLGGTRP